MCVGCNPKINNDQLEIYYGTYGNEIRINDRSCWKKKEKAADKVFREGKPKIPKGWTDKVLIYGGTKEYREYLEKLTKKQLIDLLIYHFEYCNE